MINYEYILHNPILKNYFCYQVQKYSQIMRICILDEIHIVNKMEDQSNNYSHLYIYS